MEERYSEVREYLRQQHTMNTEEIHGKKVDNLRNYRYYGNVDVKESKAQHAAVSFPMKALVFLASVMVFSCYIYGGQDVEKGAKMAFSEMKNQIHQLEEEEPAVREAMYYVRKTRDEVKDFTKTYFAIQLDEKTENNIENTGE